MRTYLSFFWRVLFICALLRCYNCERCCSAGFLFYFGCVFVCTSYIRFFGFLCCPGNHFGLHCYLGLIIYLAQAICISCAHSKQCIAAWLLPCHEVKPSFRFSTVDCWFLLLLKLACVLTLYKRRRIYCSSHLMQSWIQICAHIAHSNNHMLCMTVSATVAIVIAWAWYIKIK